ncbi:MAG TPA: dephospho-CoA kinase [Stellaceae bacterium]|nr:dephospho-CoA kinase [Stellaceae bacterium]
MKVLGLTGSVGMGKSTAAAMLRRMRLPVFDADRAVHRLLAPGGAAVAAVAQAFPGVAAADGGIDRRALGARVFGDRAALARLEAILHPLVAVAELRFLGRARAHRRRLVVMDVPLLYETGRERYCDAVAALWAPRFLQRARVLARPGMTEARLAFLRAQQVSDAEKRRRADFWVPSGLGRAVTWRRLRAAARRLRDGGGDADPCVLEPENVGE